MLKMMNLLFLFFFGFGQVESGLDSDLKALAAYKFGDSRAPLQRIEDRVLQSSRDTAFCAKLADRMAAMLFSGGVTLPGKRFLCRQLGLIGSERQVEALAGLLDDEALAEDARYALERIPGEASLNAMREALSRAEGPTLAGLIQALGDQRDQKSVAPIREQLGSDDAKVKTAAVIALGKIGGPASLDALFENQKSLLPEFQATFSHALLECAHSLIATDHRELALLLFESLVEPIYPASVRRGAFSALLATNEERAAAWAMKAVREEDSALRAAALGYIQARGEPGLFDALAGSLASVPEGVQPVIFHVLMARGYYDAAALGSVLESDLSEEVRRLAGEAVLESAIDRLENLALGARAESPDGLEMDGAAAGDAAGIDGNPATYWDEQDNQPLYRYRVIFDSPNTVSALSITGWSHHDFAPKDFEVVLDEVTVETVQNAVYKENRLWVFLPRTACRTVELKITGYYGRSPAIRELEIFHVDESIPLALLKSTRPSLKEITIPMEEYLKIERAAPASARAAPKKKRKLLVFSRSWGYKHSAIPYGDAAVEILARKTKAFDATITRDASLFEKESLEQFDAVLFNNTNNEIFLPENFDKLPQEEQEKAREIDVRLKRNLVDYLWQGGGLAVTHAGVASFRQWPEFGEIMGARFDNHPWNAGSTVVLKVDDPGHPAAQAFVESPTLEIQDEIYQLKEFSRERLRVLVSLDMEKTKVTPGQRKLIHREDNDFPMTYVKSYGQGRIFYCALGHMHELFWNPTVLQHYLDGIQFALGDLKGAVTPSATAPEPEFSWHHSGDYSAALLNHGRIVWQVVNDHKLDKAYFHPVSLPDGEPLTWLSPPDHEWHRALWFEWKFINGVNYWETSPDMGLTSMNTFGVIKERDFSAGIVNSIEYHPPGMPPVMKEERIIRVSPPNEDGGYVIDWHGEFTALEDLELNRTPPPDEPDGKSWGGYAGMSMRLAKETKDWLVLDSEGRTGMECHRQPARWIACGFTHKATNRKAVIAILDHPKNPRHPPPSFIVLNPDIPFIYYSPALLFNGPLFLSTGKTLELQYRIVVSPGGLDGEGLDEEWKRFTEGEDHDEK